jgi:hypothetical protein
VEAPSDEPAFLALGWRIYNQYWVPNQGAGCTANAGCGTLATK